MRSNIDNTKNVYIHVYIFFQMIFPYKSPNYFRYFCKYKALKVTPFRAFYNLHGKFLSTFLVFL